MLKILPTGGRGRERGGGGERGVHTHNGVLKEVVLLVVLLEEEDVAVLPRPGAVDPHHLLMVLHLPLWGRCTERPFNHTHINTRAHDRPSQCTDPQMCPSLTETNVSKLLHQHPVGGLVKMVLDNQEMADHGGGHAFLHHHRLVAAVRIKNLACVHVCVCACVCAVSEACQKCSLLPSGLPPNPSPTTSPVPHTLHPQLHTLMATLFLCASFIFSMPIFILSSFSFSSRSSWGSKVITRRVIL